MNSDKARRRLGAFSFCMLALLATQTAFAGRPCNDPEAPGVATVTKALNLAVQTQQSLNESKARVVLIGRAGQDLSKYGLHYSHMGFAYRQLDEKGYSNWRIFHKLNQCGSSSSDIYRQGLGDFYMDDLWRYEAVVIVPREDVQDRLMEVIADPKLSLQMHHKPYSLVSYAWGLKYQQSNQWVLETLALAMAPKERQAGFTRFQAQDWLKSTGYQPTVLNIDPLTRLGARLTKANVAFDDHPDDKRYSDHIETVTVDSAVNWLKKSGLAQTVFTLPLPVQTKVIRPEPKPAVQGEEEAVVVKPPPEAFDSCVIRSNVQCSPDEIQAWKKPWLLSLGQNIKYPTDPALKGRSGDARLQIVQCPGAVSVKARLLSSSGIAEFDAAAVNAAAGVRQSALLCSGSPGAYGFTVPVRFSPDQN